MTQQQKLKEVVEATGGCWHESHVNCSHICGKCDIRVGYFDTPGTLNPSPSDLNALFDLAEKLGFASVLIEGDRGVNAADYLCQIIRWPNGYHAAMDQIEVFANHPAEALLNALHEAVKK